MLNFSDSFFFLKFSSLFFIVMIFGVWGIDLNSEEIYIAFSFFLLIILAVIAWRGAILMMFVDAFNSKYSFFLTELSALNSLAMLQLFLIKKLRLNLVLVVTTTLRVILDLFEFFSKHLILLRSVFRSLAIKLVFAIYRLKTFRFKMFTHSLVFKKRKVNYFFDVKC